MTLLGVSWHSLVSDPSLQSSEGGGGGEAGVLFNKKHCSSHTSTCILVPNTADLTLEYPGLTLGFPGLTLGVPRPAM